MKWLFLSKRYSSKVQVNMWRQLSCFACRVPWDSCHGSQIWNESVLEEDFRQGRIRGILPSNGSYVRTPYTLLIQLSNPSSPEEEHWNKAQIRWRNTIEIQFFLSGGRIKQKFGCLLRAMTVLFDNSNSARHKISLEKSIRLIQDWIGRRQFV